MATLIYGCSLSHSLDTKLIDYGSFTMEVPLNWKPLAVEFEDSAIGNIQIGKKSFISFDLGQYSNPLNEDDFGEYYKISDGNIYLVDKSSTLKNKKLNYFGKVDSINLEKVRRDKVEWIIIDGFKTKLLTPKKAGRGFVGVYIDSLSNDNGTKIKLMMSGYLTPTQQEEFMSAIKTLKFYNKPTALKKLSTYRKNYNSRYEIGNLLYICRYYEQEYRRDF